MACNYQSTEEQLMFLTLAVTPRHILRLTDSVYYRNHDFIFSIRGYRVFSQISVVNYNLDESRYIVIMGVGAKDVPAQERCSMDGRRGRTADSGRSMETSDRLFLELFILNISYTIKVTRAYSGQLCCNSRYYFFTQYANMSMTRVRDSRVSVNLLR